MKKPKPQPEELQNVITKTERTSFLKKFTEEETISKQKNLSELLMQKFELEGLIEKSKLNIKSIEFELKIQKKELEDGGIKKWDECEVKIYRDTMKKEFYFEGVLVDTEEADESDFQLEIEEEEETDEN